MVKARDVARKAVSVLRQYVVLLCLVKLLGVAIGLPGGQSGRGKETGNPKALAGDSGAKRAGPTGNSESNATVRVNETFPAAVAEQATLAQVQEILRGTMAARDVKSMVPVQNVYRFDRDTASWFRMQIHSYLAQVLPGVRFYVTPTVATQPILPAVFRQLPVAYHAGRVYELPYQVNLLLRDCGMEFESSDFPVWARILTLVYCFWQPDSYYVEGLSRTVHDKDVLLPELTIETITDLRDTVVVKYRIGAREQVLEIECYGWGSQGKQYLVPDLLGGAYLEESTLDDQDVPSIDSMGFRGQESIAHPL